MHDAIWYDGVYNGSNTSTPTDATQLMAYGLYLNYSSVLTAVDLDNRSGPTNAVTAWFENLLVPNLINNWFKSNNVYIVYIPYGPVMGLNSDNTWEIFTEENCTAQWVGSTNWYSGADWNSTVVASCEDGGMAVLMNGGSTMEKPSFYEIANVTWNNNSYSAQDMITSSLDGFLNYGFK